MALMTSLRCPGGAGVVEPASGVLVLKQDTLVASLHDPVPWPTGATSSFVPCWITTGGFPGRTVLAGEYSTARPAGLPTLT